MRCYQLRVKTRGRERLWSELPFPLTPTLSRRERGKVSPRIEPLSAADFSLAQAIGSLSRRERIPRTNVRALNPRTSMRLLSRPSATLSSIRNGGEGWGEEVLRFMGREKVCPQIEPPSAADFSLARAIGSLSQRERAGVRENGREVCSLRFAQTIPIADMTRHRTPNHCCARIPARGVHAASAFACRAS